MNAELTTWRNMKLRSSHVSQEHIKRVRRNTNVVYGWNPVLWVMPENKSTAAVKLCRAVVSSSGSTGT